MPYGFFSYDRWRLDTHGLFVPVAQFVVKDPARQCIPIAAQAAPRGRREGGGNWLAARAQSLHALADDAVLGAAVVHCISLWAEAFGLGSGWERIRERMLRPYGCWWHV